MDTRGRPASTASASTVSSSWSEKEPKLPSTEFTKNVAQIYNKYLLSTHRICLYSDRVFPLSELFVRFLSPRNVFTLFFVIRWRKTGQKKGSRRKMLLLPFEGFLPASGWVCLIILTLLNPVEGCDTSAVIFFMKF